MRVSKNLIMTDLMGLVGLSRLSGLPRLSGLLGLIVLLGFNGFVTSVKAQTNNYPDHPMLSGNMVLPISLTNWSISNSIVNISLANSDWLYEDSDPGYLNTISPVYTLDGRPTFVNFIYDSRDSNEVSLTVLVGGGPSGVMGWGREDEETIPTFGATYQGVDFNNLILDPSSFSGWDTNWMPPLVNLSQKVLNSQDWADNFSLPLGAYQQDETLLMLSKLFGHAQELGEGLSFTNGQWEVK